MHSHTKPFESHSCIHMMIGQIFQTSVRFPVVLHKYKVPDFNHQWIILIHQFTTGFQFSLLLGPEVDMDFRTRPTRSHIPHFPKIIFFIAEEDSILGQIIHPNFTGFCISFQSVLFASFKDSSVQPVFIQPHYSGQEFPGKSNRIFFEIITERPVPQHLEHRMMICIVSYLFQVVVFSGNPETFLRVRDTPVFGIDIPKNNIFELIHSCVCKHQRRIVLNHHGCRRDDSMSLTFKKIQKLLSDLC